MKSLTHQTERFLTRMRWKALFFKKQEEDSENEGSDVENDIPFEIPKRRRKRKQKILKIPKINPRGVKRSPPPPPPRPKPFKRPKVSDIPSKSLSKSN